jgi:iron complex transport system substrate-binding protein
MPNHVIEVDPHPTPSRSTAGWMVVRMAVLAVAVAACGAGAASDASGGSTPAADGTAGTVETTASSEPAETTEPGEAGTGGETRTVETGMGPVEVPADPQRIVALDIRVLQLLDELGTPLVGTQTRTEGVWTELSDEAQQLPSIWVRGEDIDLEAVVELEPDLIVGGGLGDGNEDLYPQLSEIAPTVLAGADGDWRDLMREVAVAVNRTAEAEELIAGVEASMPELESAIGARWPDGVQITLLRVRDDIRITQVADRNTSSGPWLLNEIDAISVTGDLRDVEEDGISPEQLREADGDVILYFGGGGGSNSTQDDEFLLNVIDNPLWDGLSAVQAGRAHVVDSDIWFDGRGVTAAHLAVEDLMEYVANAP